MQRSQPPPPPSGPPPGPQDDDEESLPPPTDDGESPPQSEDEPFDEDLPPFEDEDDLPAPSDDDDNLPLPSDEDDGSEAPPSSPPQSDGSPRSEASSPGSDPEDSPWKTVGPDGDALSDEGPNDEGSEELSAPGSDPEDEPGDDDLPSDMDMSEPSSVPGDEEDLDMEADGMTPSSDISGDFEDEDEPMSDPDDEDPDDIADPDDLSEPPDDEFPDEISELDEIEDAPKKSQNKFKLPVKTAATGKGRGTAADDLSSSDAGTPATVSAQLDALGSGLLIKQPPKLLGKDSSGHELQQTDDDYLDGSVEEKELEEGIGGSVANSYLASLRDPAEVKQQALAENFTQAHAKFEGDDFEIVFLKVDSDNSSSGSGDNSRGDVRNTLFVRVATGPQADFDLSSQAYVFEDSEDPTRLILEYHKSIIVFKFDDVETALLVLKDLPSQVFMSAELTEEEERLLRGEYLPDKKIKKALQKPKIAPSTKSAAGPAGKYTDSHIKGTSVEDLLEENFAAAGAQANGSEEQIDKLFFQGNIGNLGLGSTAGAFPVAPQRRKELLESHIRRPQYSVRRVTLLCEWINSLHIWPNTVDINSLHKEICNGLLLARIVKTINPAAQFLNLNEKALAKKAALENLEQALGNIWRSKSLNNSRIPTAADIYTGNTSKTAILLNELFGVYVQRPLYKNAATKILKWYHVVLKQYSRPLPENIFNEGDLSSVWPHFQSGTALFCVIYHFFGPSLIGQGATTIRIDPLRVAGHPTSICDFRSNLFYAFQLLEALNIDVIWTPEDWISNPDTEFIMLQLSYIYEALKYKQGALPPAQGAQAGMTSGPNGEPLVVGMIFSDTRPPHARIQQFQRRAVLLGHDKDSMPLLPVDRSYNNNSSSGGNSVATGRFSSSRVCPLGMVSNNAQIALMPQLQLKERHVHSARGGWDISASIRDDDRNSPTHDVLQLLREHNKRTTSSSSDNFGSSSSHGGGELTKQSTFTSLAAVPISEMVPVVGPGTLAAGRLVTAMDKSNLQLMSSPERTIGGGKSYSATAQKAMLQQQQQQQQLSSTSKLSIQTGHTSAAATTTSTAPSAAQQKAAEIDQAIKNLEREMKDSDLQLNALEEELAGRYLLLETRAASLQLEEYEAALDELEDERRELEDERTKLQEHFALKLASIKDIYQEVEYLSQQQQQPQSIDTPYSISQPPSSTRSQQQQQRQTPGSINSSSNRNKQRSSPTHSHSYSSPGKTPSKQQHSSGVAESKKVQAAEKGWIKTSRNDTHNYALRNRQQASSSALQTSWTPRTLKQKEKQRADSERAKALAQSEMPPHLREISLLLSASPTSRGPAAGGPTIASVAAQLATARAARATAAARGKASANVDGQQQQQQQISEEEKVELSFSKFKYRLHFASVKWLQAKQQTGRARLMDMINSNTFVPKVELISLPEKSFSQAAGGITTLSAEEQQQWQRLSLAIREDESARMIYEDERRRMVMSEQALLQSYELTEHIWTAASAAATAAQTAAAGDDYDEEATPAVAALSGSNPVTPDRLQGFADASYFIDDQLQQQQQQFASGTKMQQRFASSDVRDDSSNFTDAAAYRSFSPDYLQQLQQHQQQQGQQQQQSSRSYNQQQGAVDLSPNSGATTAAATGAAYLQRPKPSEEEVESAYRWLSTPRLLVMADRSPKEFTFIVVDSTLVGSDNDSTPYSSGVDTAPRSSRSRSNGGSGSDGRPQQQQHAFTLQWREAIELGDSVQEFVMGHIHLIDAKDIAVQSTAATAAESAMDHASSSNDSFTIHIKNSTKALRNSKGRTSCTIQCNSPGECGKYVAMLQCIRRSYD